MLYLVKPNATEPKFPNGCAAGNARQDIEIYDGSADASTTTGKVPSAPKPIMSNDIARNIINTSMQTKSILGWDEQLFM